MAYGPGKYDDLCTWVREQAEAKTGVVLIVFDGRHGDGFSAQTTTKALLSIPAALRKVADDIEKSVVDAMGEAEQGYEA